MSGAPDENPRRDGDENIKLSAPPNYLIPRRVEKRPRNPIPEQPPLYEDGSFSSNIRRHLLDDPDYVKGVVEKVINEEKLRKDDVLSEDDESSVEDRDAITDDINTPLNELRKIIKDGEKAVHEINEAFGWAEHLVRKIDEYIPDDTEFASEAIMDRVQTFYNLAWNIRDKSYKVAQLIKNSLIRLQRKKRAQSDLTPPENDANVEIIYDKEMRNLIANARKRLYIVQQLFQHLRKIEIQTIVTNDTQNRELYDIIADLNNALRYFNVRLGRFERALSGRHSMYEFSDDDEMQPETQKPGKQESYADLERLTADQHGDSMSESGTDPGWNDESEDSGGSSDEEEELVSDSESSASPSSDEEAPPSKKAARPKSPAKEPAAAVLPDDIDIIAVITQIVSKNNSNGIKSIQIADKLNTDFYKGQKPPVVIKQHVNQPYNEGFQPAIFSKAYPLQPGKRYPGIYRIVDELSKKEVFYQDASSNHHLNATLPAKKLELAEQPEKKRDVELPIPVGHSSSKRMEPPLKLYTKLPLSIPLLPRLENPLVLPIVARPPTQPHLGAQARVGPHRDTNPYPSNIIYDEDMFDQSINTIQFVLSPEHTSAGGLYKNTLLCTNVADFRGILKNSTKTVERVIIGWDYTGDRQQILDERDIIDLEAAISLCKNLKSLVLNNPPMSNDALITFLSIISNCKDRLQHFCLHLKNVGADMYMLNTYLQKCDQLNTLDLCFHKKDCNSIINLIPALQAMKQLKTFYFTCGTELSDENMFKLRRSVSKCPLNIVVNEMKPTVLLLQLNNTDDDRDEFDEDIYNPNPETYKDWGDVFAYYRVDKFCTALYRNRHTLTAIIIENKIRGEYDNCITKDHLPEISRFLGFCTKLNKVTIRDTPFKVLVGSSISAPITIDDNDEYPMESTISRFFSSIKPDLEHIEIIHDRTFSSIVQQFYGGYLGIDQIIVTEFHCILLTELATELAKFKRLKTLKLSNLNLDARAIDIFKDVFANLISLNISHNEIGKILDPNKQHTCTWLTKGIPIENKFGSIQKLDISNNDIDFKDLLNLYSMLPNKTLTTLHMRSILNGNLFESPMAYSDLNKELISAFLLKLASPETKQHLEYLDISTNKLFPASGNFAWFVSNCTALQQLHMENTDFGSENIDTFAEAISHCLTLHTVYIGGNNRLTDDDAKKLLAAKRKNPRLCIHVKESHWAGSLGLVTQSVADKLADIELPVASVKSGSDGSLGLVTRSVADKLVATALPVASVKSVSVAKGNLAPIYSGVLLRMAPKNPIQSVVNAQVDVVWVISNENRNGTWPHNITLKQLKGDKVLYRDFSENFALAIKHNDLVNICVEINVGDKANVIKPVFQLCYKTPENLFVWFGPELPCMIIVSDKADGPADSDTLVDRLRDPKSASNIKPQQTSSKTATGRQSYIIEDDDLSASSQSPPEQTRRKSKRRVSSSDDQSPIASDVDLSDDASDVSGDQSPIASDADLSDATDSPAPKKATRGKKAKSTAKSGAGKHAIGRQQRHGYNLNCEITGARTGDLLSGINEDTLNTLLLIKSGSIIPTMANFNLIPEENFIELLIKKYSKNITMNDARQMYNSLRPTAEPNGGKANLGGCRFIIKQPGNWRTFVTEEYEDEFDSIVKNETEISYLNIIPMMGKKKLILREELFCTVVGAIEVTDVPEGTVVTQTGLFGGFNEDSCTIYQIDTHFVAVPRSAKTMLQKSDVIYLVTQAFLPEPNVEHIQMCYDNLIKLTDGGLKSALQKVIRFNADRVQLIKCDDGTACSVPSEYYAVMATALLMVSSGTFNPELQLHVLGRTAAFKRLAIICVEDVWIHNSFFHLDALMGLALITSKIKDWYPPEKMVVAVLQMVRNFRSPLIVKWQQTRKIEQQISQQYIPVSSKECKALERASSMLKVVKSFSGDIKMYETIVNMANTTKNLQLLRSSDAPAKIMPACHIWDHHNKRAIGHILPITFGATFVDRFRILFDEITGINPRWTDVSNFERRPKVMDARYAQNIIMDFVQQRNAKNILNIVGQSVKIHVPIHPGTLAAGIGPIEMKYPEKSLGLFYNVVLGVQFPENEIVMKRLTREKSDPEPFKVNNEVQNILINKCREQTLKVISPLLPPGTATFDGSKWLFNNKPWQEVVDNGLHLHIPICKLLESWKTPSTQSDDSKREMDICIEQALFSEGTGMVENVKTHIKSLVLCFGTEVTMRVRSLLRQQYAVIEMPIPNKSGLKASDEDTPFENDWLAYRFLVLLSCLAPAALAPLEPPNFKVKNSALLRHLEKFIKPVIASGVVASHNWATFFTETVKDKLHARSESDKHQYQKTALEALKNRDRNDVGGHMLILPTGTGKTTVTMQYIMHRLLNTNLGAIIRQIIWVCPSDKVFESLRADIGAMGVNALEQVESLNSKRWKKSKALLLAPCKIYILKQSQLSTAMTKSDLPSYAASSFVVLDDCHYYFNKTQRTGAARELARRSALFIAQTATPFPRKPDYLKEWLVDTESYPVTKDNMLVAASNMVMFNPEFAITRHKEVERIKIVQEVSDAKEQYIQNRYNWQNVWKITQNHTNASLCQTALKYIRSDRHLNPELKPGGGVLLVADNKVHAELLLSIMNQLLVAPQTCKVYEDKTTLTELNNKDLVCVIVTKQQNSGYNFAARYGVIVKGVYPGNSSDRIQMEGRIYRSNQLRLHVYYVTVLMENSILETLHKYQEDSDMLKVSFDQIAAQTSRRRQTESEALEQWLKV